MVRYVANILVYLALAVWIGGLLSFGVFVAPTLFGGAVSLPRDVAGAINSAILGRLGMVEVACGVVLVGGTLYGVVRIGSWMNWSAFLLSIAMLATSFYYARVLFPEMDRLRVQIGSFENLPAEKAPLKKQFDDGHLVYSRLARGVLIGGVLVLVLQTASLVRYSGRRHPHRHAAHHRSDPPAVAAPSPPN